MVSKRKISYQLKLFIPIVAVLWTIIIGFTYIQYQRDKDYRSELLRSRVDIINKRALDLIEAGDDPTPYLEFLDNYFQQTILDDLSMTLYDLKSGEMKIRLGFPAPPPGQYDLHGSLKGSEISANNNDDSVYIEPDRAFYYNVDRTDDGKYLVQTFVPMDGKISEEISGRSWWIAFVILACSGVTIVTFITTKHLSKNVRLLREFVSNAADDHDFVAIDKFSNDELGDISRQVVNIYNMRKAALASRELEHRVALKATEERANLKRQLTNNINHELKTPTSIIKGYIDTIVENPSMDEESRNHFILKTQDQVTRLCNILNDLSMMTRIEEGSHRIAIEEIDFNEFVENLTSDIEESGVCGEMTFTASVPPNCKIKGNNTLLTAAIMNLVKNAVAYSKGTEMGLKLLTENQRFYTFIFYDNGQGVSEEHIPMLFERFYRVDKGRSRKSGGTGLGLPIVRNSINTIGGSISVNNRKGGGLEFVFTLRKWREGEKGVSRQPDTDKKPQNAGQ